MTDESTDRFVERLVKVLAAQVEASATPGLAPGAVAALSGLRRDEAGLIFGHVGHLVHYGVDTEGLENLARLVSGRQRGEAGADDAIRPGDQVRLVGELPAEMAGYDQDILREWRFVGSDGTVDVQPAFTDDYFIETVPVTAVRLEDR